MKLYDPGTLTAFLKRYGIAASKGLGQHFLCSESAVDSIIEAVGPSRGICEIGPGPGVLTSPLSLLAEKTIALELDQCMIQALKESSPSAEVRKQDALDVDLISLLLELPEPRAVVSNLPYYITGPLVSRIAEARDYYSVAVLMMQREVAQRIIAKAGKRERGSLSVYLQSQFEISLVAQVPASAFLPPPKVDSTVLKFVPKSFVGDETFQKDFYRIVRISFAQPRKTLANNLVAGLHRSREEMVEAIEAVGLEEKIRPHDLTQAQWVELCQRLES